MRLRHPLRLVLDHSIRPRSHRLRFRAWTSTEVQGTYSASFSSIPKVGRLGRPFLNHFFCFLGCVFGVVVLMENDITLVHWEIFDAAQEMLLRASTEHLRVPSFVYIS